MNTGKTSINITLYSPPPPISLRGFGMNASKLNWIKFGIEGSLLSIIASATCSCADRLGAIVLDGGYNMLSLIMLVVGVVILIVGVVGAVFTKSDD